MLTPRFTAAVAYALDVHGGMTRHGKTPFMAHLLGVTSLVLRYGGTEDEAIGALLHDTAEDAGGHKRLADIEAHFGPAIARIVEGCSDSLETPKASWSDRKRAYIARVPDEPADVIRVSVADKIYNVGTIIDDYKSEGDALWERLNTPANKAGRIGYYRGLVGAYRANGHHQSMVDELDRRVTDLETLCGMRGAL
jgi:GTP pyrophosphokinase